MGASESRPEEGETRKDLDVADQMNTTSQTNSTLAAVAGAAAGVAVAAWGISRAISSSKQEDDDKMMKRPGQTGYMPRKDFEDDPKTYFRGLRGKSAE